MAMGYAALIEAKRRTIEQVLSSFREEVLEILRQRGLDGYGDKLEDNVVNEK